MEDVVEIVRIAKSYSFTRSEVSSIVEYIAKKYLKENSIPLNVIDYVTMFDNNRNHIFIYLVDINTVTICGQICIYIADKTSDYAFIYGLYVSPEVRRRKYAEALVKIAEAAISTLMFEGSYLEATPGTWMVDWYKRLGYEVYTEDAEKNIVGLSKQLS